jgi:hypothetical protein
MMEMLKKIKSRKKTLAIFFYSAFSFSPKTASFCMSAQIHQSLTHFQAQTNNSETLRRLSSHVHLI